MNEPTICGESGCQGVMEERRMLSPYCDCGCTCMIACCPVCDTPQKDLHLSPLVLVPAASEDDAGFVGTIMYTADDGCVVGVDPSDRTKVVCHHSDETKAKLAKLEAIEAAQDNADKWTTPTRTDHDPDGFYDHEYVELCDGVCDLIRKSADDWLPFHRTEALNSKGIDE